MKPKGSCLTFLLVRELGFSGNKELVSELEEDFLPRMLNLNLGNLGMLGRNSSETESSSNSMKMQNISKPNRA